MMPQAATPEEVTDLLDRYGRIVYAAVTGQTPVPADPRAAEAVRALAIYAWGLNGRMREQVGRSPTLAEYEDGLAELARNGVRAAQDAAKATS
jgi:hypothetical protein